MKRGFRKNLSIALSVLIMIGIVFAVPVSAGAATADDPAVGASRVYTDIVGGVTYCYTIQYECAVLESVRNCKETVTLPTRLGGRAISNISKAAFSGITILREVTIPKGIKCTGNSMFINCKNLQKANVNCDIGQNTFENCTSLKTVVLGNTVTSINSNAFLGCTALKSISIPKSVSYLGNSGNSIGSPFANCTSLTSFTVASDNPYYYSNGGVVFTKDKKTLFAFPTGKTGTYTVPTGTQTIEQYAFQTSRIENVIIPDNSVKKIKPYAFDACSKLKTAKFGNGLKSIGYRTFRSCSSLTSVSTPNSVTGIGYDAFINCTAVKTAVIGSGVTAISDNLFNGCSALTKVTVRGVVKKLNENAFKDCKKLSSINLPEGLQEIDSCVFLNCGSLKSLTLPESLTFISHNRSLGYYFSGGRYRTYNDLVIYGYANSEAQAYAKRNNLRFSVISKEVNPTSVSINKTAVTITEGSYQTLTATVLPSNATNKSVTWSSSNSKVASVSGGKVTAVAAGTATITAKTVNGKTANCTVTVKKVTVLPTSVSLNKSSLTVDMGKSVTLTATVLPSNATDKNVTWSSSNTKTATVTNGVITGINAGTATITATTSNGKTAKCTVTVKKAYVYPASVSLNSTTIITYPGYSVTLKATVLPSNATDKSVTWSSSNTKVATVTNGKVVPVAVGSATITATTSNGKKAACSVTVKSSAVTPTSISLAPESFWLGVGEKCCLKATITPSNADQTVTWKSSDSSVLSVDSTGYVTAKKTGTATITAKTVNGKQSSCKVTVKPAPTSVSVTPATLKIVAGKTYTIESAVNSGSYANTAYYQWSSSNEKVATVTKQSGGKAVVKAVAKGSAVITLKLYNGKTAVCKVVVS